MSGVRGAGGNPPAGTPRLRPCKLETRPSRPGTPCKRIPTGFWRRIGVWVWVVLLLGACERQADRVFDRNPEYAGKADVRSEEYPDAETLRHRVRQVQTDR